MRQCLANVQLFLSVTEPQFYCRDTVKPRYTEGTRDRQTLFAITMFRYIKFLTTVLLGGKKIVRYTEDFAI